MGVTITPKLQADFGAGWVTISSDLADNAVQHSLGINGDAPTDVVADGGALTYRLRNAGVNSGKALGYYSPGHASVRSGWDYGIKTRMVYTYSGTDYVRWTGKIAEIDPDPNPRGSKYVRVVAHDYMQDLEDAEVRAIAPQVGQLESTLLGTILDAVPTASQPLARSIASGIDTVPYVFDKLGTKTKAVEAIRDVTLSSFGIAYVKSDGTFVYKTRQTRFSASSLATLTDNETVGLSGPTSRAGSANVVRVTYHPKHITAGIVLWSYTGSTPQVVRAGETITVWTNYRDPNQTNTEIGASAITAPSAGTDYIANEAADGSGLVVTSNLSVTTNRYSASTQWIIQNTGATDAHLTTWQIRGTGIFDDGAQTVESRSAQAYGERPLDIDLPYQADRHVAYGLAQLVREQRENPTTIVRQVSFRPKASSTLATLAMTAEPGDIITLSNSMTGLSSATAIIQNIGFSIKPSGDIICTFGLAPTSALTPPTAPTGLAVAVYSDTELTPSWTNTDVTAETEVYVDGTLWTVAAAGATSIRAAGFTRCTNYTLTAKHVKYSLIRSSATSGVVGRPTVVATGGTIFNGTLIPGYKVHQFFSTGTFTITAGGRVNMQFVGDGGGGGGSDAAFIGGGGGGGGELLTILDNVEPPNAYTVTVGAGGAGAVKSVSAHGATGSGTSYRSVGALGGGGGGSFFTSGGASSPGEPGGSGGGGSGEGGHGAAGNLGYAGGDGGAAGSGYRTGGGGGGAAGAGGAGVTGGSGSSVGGAGGTAVNILGTPMGAGGQGGGPAGASGADATGYGNGGAGNLNGDGGDGAPGFAQFWYPV